MIPGANKWKLLAIMSVSMLMVIAFRENYPQKIKDVFYHPLDQIDPENDSFRSNDFYKEQTDYQSLFKAQRNIVMLGNSLTFRMHWDELLDRSDVANRGIGSDVIKGFYHRLDKVIELSPKICFIEGGANDIDFGIETDTSLYYLDLIIDSLGHSGIIPVVSHVIFVTNEYPGAIRFNQLAREFNSKVDQLSREKQIEVIDLNADIAPHGYLESRFAQPDGIHLTSVAYTIWKRKVLDMLRIHQI
jgi:lysophospholipase L1-like esterase